MYLNCHTYYSLRYGAFSEEELLRQAGECGCSAVVLTDINNTSACLNFIRLAPKYGIRPIVGVDFRNGAEICYIGIAKNNHGFYHLNGFLSRHLMSQRPFPIRAPKLPDVYFIYPSKAFHTVKQLRRNEFLGIRKEDVARLEYADRIFPAKKLVIWQPVTFRNKRDFNVHRILRAIDKNTLLSKLSKEEEAQPDEVMIPTGELVAAYKKAPHIVENTRQLLCKCSIEFDFSEERPPQNQATCTGSVEEDEALLKQLALDGVTWRYGDGVDDPLLDRINKELGIIRQMKFVSYFLINWEIVNYARSKDYFYVGRGSGANSVIAYLLGITNVDPMALDLYFERFINVHRTSPPDFDLDFSWKDREDVTRFIFERFKHTSLLATYNTFQYKGAVREVGKVFGLPKHEMDKLSKGRFSMRELDSLTQLVLRYSGYLQGMPNHLSIHSGGILISERPINYYSATNLPPKGFPTVQFDMVIAEDVGLFKFDILGQRGLAKIKEAMVLVRKNHPEAMDVDIHQVDQFMRDPKINTMIREARCLGCFYIESPAMRMLLKKLDVNDYLGLVAASSIIRPGVARSGMMKEYILRSKDASLATKRAHPFMLEIMPDTFGVMVYQEDVIRVAHLFAGLTLGESDVLRRAMSGKYRSREEFAKVRDRFFANCNARKYAPETIREIWHQIESFAGYAFAKGHSASYAVESYQSLYLKTYYPLEYMVAVINNGGGFYRTETYVHEARMLGAVIHPPDVNKSEGRTTLYGRDIYLGFGLIKSIDTTAAKSIVVARDQGGLFDGLQNFIERVPLGIESLTHLIRVGAFGFTGIDKKRLMWQAHFLLGKSPPKVFQQQLFTSERVQFALPEFEAHSGEDAFNEMELLGFPLCSPFELLTTPPDNAMVAAHFPKYHRRSIVMYGYMVALKVTRTANGKRMYFGTFRDQTGHFFDTVHFPNVAKTYPIYGKGVYKISGSVAEEFGFYSMEVKHIVKMDYMPDPRYTVNTVQ